MIHLITGANGTGKTLLTLKEVRDISLRENRRVAWNGRFRMRSDFGWSAIDAKDWQAQPDGTIFLFDEAHNDFPIRSGRDGVPEYVRMLAEHRVRGFDFYLITQHPLNIDVFVRRLIGAPSSHRHIKRKGGSNLVTVTTYASVNDSCSKPGAAEDGDSKAVAFPKEVFDWYESATLHTAKFTLPRKAIIGLVAAALVPVLGFFAYRSLSSNFQKKAPEVQSSAFPENEKKISAAPTSPQKGPATTAEFVQSFVPRLAGLPHTAPRYDAATAPTEAPYPAACVASKKQGCRCYTQQGTRLQVDPSMCAQVVADGFFMDWKSARGDVLPSLRSPAPSVPAQPSPPAQPVQVVLAQASPQFSQTLNGYATPEPVARPSDEFDGANIARMRRAR